MKLWIFQMSIFKKVKIIDMKYKEAFLEEFLKKIV